MSRLRLGSLCYLPPPTVGHSQVFFDHIQAYKRASELILYSDHPWPGAVMLKGNPEQFKQSRAIDGSPTKFGTANSSFFAGLKIAWTSGYTHVILLEPDVRVGEDFWDRRIWDEFFDLGFPCVAAGTLAVYNPCNHSPVGAARWAELVRRNPRRNFPIATYGYLPAGNSAGSCIFPNGALAVYDLAWLNKIFDLANVDYANVARQTAWDQWIGFKIWEVFREDSYLVLGHLDCIYSGFGNVVTTPEQRRALLLSGEICAIHQEKENWVPPKP